MQVACQAGAGEAAGLRWRDIDLDHGTILICQQLQQYAGRLTITRPKTASSERAVVLDHTTTTVLRRHRAAQQAEQDTAGPAWHDTGYAFTTRHGDPVAPDWLTRHFRDLTSAAGLPPVRLHDLRHGAASLALAAGADLRTIQDQLGHASIVLTPTPTSRSCPTWPATPPRTPPGSSSPQASARPAPPAPGQPPARSPGAPGPPARSATDGSQPLADAGRPYHAHPPPLPDPPAAEPDSHQPRSD